MRQGLELRRLRELTLAAPPAIGRPSHVSAASGLVWIGSQFYVVADDELHLGVFSQDASASGRLIRLFDGALPDSKAERKKRKPDLETLLRVPRSPGYPHGALIALGSGSTAARCRGAACPLDKTGGVVGGAKVLDLTRLYESIATHVAHLNIEGATISGQVLRLYNRGNTASPASQVIAVPLSVLDEALATGIAPPAQPAIDLLDLGNVDGVPYSVTDAAKLDRGLTVVSAVAEDTADAYSDGACIGAMIALLDSDLSLLRTWPLELPHKIEGVSAERIDRRIVLHLVSDADDPALPALLYGATVTI